jgi:hypothetical protein
MNGEADIVRQHAELITGEALARARGRLQALSPDQQRTVERLAQRIAEQIGRLLREECEHCPELADYPRLQPSSSEPPLSALRSRGPDES